MLRKLKNRLRPRPPREVAARFRTLGADQQQQLRAVLKEHYFAAAEAGYLESTAGQYDLENHVTGRLDHDRAVVVPWLDHARRLAGTRILEIGCGTGCSTVALAEQGAEVVGVDVSESALRVAEARCALYGVPAELHAINVVDVDKAFGTRRFDMVIFYASLEHMTIDERLAGLAATWHMLGPQGLLGVIETPNRLWYEDGHTALLPFYFWLPDELALAYARYSPRPGFCNRYEKATEEQLHRFRREGRGVSYHEFELALGTRAADFEVASSLYTYRPYLNWLRAMRLAQPREVRYAALLHALQPSIDRSFFRPQLDLLLAK